MISMDDQETAVDLNLAVVDFMLKNSCAPFGTNVTPCLYTAYTPILI